MKVITLLPGTLGAGDVGATVTVMGYRLLAAEIDGDSSWRAGANTASLVGTLDTATSPATLDAIAYANADSATKWKRGMGYFATGGTGAVQVALKIVDYAAGTPFIRLLVEPILGTS